MLNENAPNRYDHNTHVPMLSNPRLRHTFCCFQGDKNIDNFLEVVEVNLRKNPCLLFVALRKTSQENVLDQTEECWRSVVSHLLILYVNNGT